jgi:hypothetical protein
MSFSMPILLEIPSCVHNFKNNLHFLLYNLNTSIHVSLYKHVHFVKQNMLHSNRYAHFWKNINFFLLISNRGRRGRDGMVVGFIATMQSVPITTKVMSSNLVPEEVYSIQHYVIKFVGDLRQIGGFLRGLRCPPPIKLTATI